MILLTFTLLHFYYALGFGFGLILLTQIVLSFVGGDADSDMDIDSDIDSPDYDSDGSGDAGTFNLLTVQSALAFLAFFGLAGAATLLSNLSPMWSIFIGAGAGLLMSIAVTGVMFLMKKLQGTKKPISKDDLVGRTATVHLFIPEKDQGVGKIQLSVRGTYVTMEALSQNGDRIPTSSIVEITEFISDTLVKVKKSN